MSGLRVSNVMVIARLRQFPGADATRRAKLEPLGLHRRPRRGAGGSAGMATPRGWRSHTSSPTPHG